MKCSHLLVSQLACNSFICNTFLSPAWHHLRLSHLDNRINLSCAAWGWGEGEGKLTPRWHTKICLAEDSVMDLAVNLLKDLQFGWRTVGWVKGSSLDLEEGCAGGVVLPWFEPSWAVGLLWSDLCHVWFAGSCLDWANIKRILWGCERKWCKPLRANRVIVARLLD